jgi:hypothetical protein
MHRILDSQHLFLSQNSRTKTEKLAEKLRAARLTGEAGGQLPGPNNLFLYQNSRTKTEKLVEKLEDNYRARITYFYLGCGVAM